MLNSLKKWVQDVAIDLAPPPPPPQTSPSSPSFLLSSTKSGPAHHQNYSSAISSNDPRRQQYNQTFIKNVSSSTKVLSRPISMESVRSTSRLSTPIAPTVTSPVEVDLSHLNREEQEHIANVLRRARAVDEQQSPKPPVTIASIQSPPASIVSVSISPSASTSSSSSSSTSSSSTTTSTSSFSGEKRRLYEQNDKIDNNIDNEIKPVEDEVASSLAESTLITIQQYPMCSKEQEPKQENAQIFFQCQVDEENARLAQKNGAPLMSIGNSSSPIPIEFNNQQDDEIYDNIAKIDQELIKRNICIEKYSPSPIAENGVEICDDNRSRQRQEEKEEKLQRQSLAKETNVSSLGDKCSRSLTEIDEDDFIYQGPSSYATAIDSIPTSDDIEQEIIIPPYTIDVYPDEDDHDERDHVKELEETIANLSRHFPISSTQINETNLNPIVKTTTQSSNVSDGKIYIDSILEMEIESPSKDDNYLNSSILNCPIIKTSPQHTVHVPISVPISVVNRRGSLSRSSGIRENLTDLLMATTKADQTCSSIPILQENNSFSAKNIISAHRQKRNLPSIPTINNRLQLRRAHSESRFHLPAVPTSAQMINNIMDDESDLLEIDLNDPIGSMDRTGRSKTESEITNINLANYNLRTVDTTNQSSFNDELISNKNSTKQLRDQTTNTSPVSDLNLTPKAKKKGKKKGSPSTNNLNGHSIDTSDQLISNRISPTPINPPSIILSSSPTPNANRPKLQKSTSTEISYPFPVQKLILNRDSRSSSRSIFHNLGLYITGGHSVSHCMEVTARIERIDVNHRNYIILKNAVKEGDEVLEAGGISLRGKSGLFVENLMNSIQDEFEIVIRSQHVIPPSLPPIEIHKAEQITRTNPIKIISKDPQNTLLATPDPNTQRRHSMGTTEFSNTRSTNNTVVKSQSTIMSAPMNNDMSTASQQSLTPHSHTRRKSVSTKERLFSIESIQRRASIKSNEYLSKETRQATSENSSLSAQQDRSVKLFQQSSLSTPTNDHKTSNDEITNSTQSEQRSRMYEHRNSLLPNDPGLNGAGSSQINDRRNSNESDESDNLSQYFHSTQSRKSSLFTTNDTVNVNTPNPIHDKLPRTQTNENDTVKIASDRLQKFLQSPDEKLRSKSSISGDLANKQNAGERKARSTLGSFKFLTRKNKSIEISNSHEIHENDYIGDIELQIGHNSEPEQLVVRIIQAKNLLAKDTNGFSDPYVKVYLLPGRDQENKRRTKYISKSLNPVWDHTVIYGNMHREELQYKTLEFTVWDYDRFKTNDFLGQVTIDLRDANVVDDKPHWYRLKALRSRDETTNRGSSPRLFTMRSIDSTSSTTSSTSNKHAVNRQSRVNQRK